MNKTKFGNILYGKLKPLERDYDEFSQIPVDLNLCENINSQSEYIKTKTIDKPVEVRSHGTFDGRKSRTIRFEPSEKPGWWFHRTDIGDAKLIKVCSERSWTTKGGVKNILLGTDMLHNYLRLTEHIIALKAGLDIDNLNINVSSEDPPLFNEGSTELINALNKAGRIETGNQNNFFTVKEKVSYQSEKGGFLIITPAKKGDKNLYIDCAVNYPNAMGKQRIKFPVTIENFTHGAKARTDAAFKHAILLKTIGKLFRDTRNLGYNWNNVIIAGKNKYYNKVNLVHDGKSLESAWHRATLDLLAAVALISEGRFAGTITSYKVGHSQDVDLIKMLYKNKMLAEIEN